jgi:hypothetical protein
MVYFVTTFSKTEYTAKRIDGPFYINVIAAVCDCTKLDWNSLSGTPGSFVVNIGETVTDYAALIPTVLASTTGASADTP